jgi:co-chaperonin GroES (HSP10)
METILGVEPKIKIPKPIGGRVIVKPIITTLTIEERYKQAGLIGVSAQKEKPRPSCGTILAISVDPIITENFKVGQLVWFNSLLGTEIALLGQSFRALDFNDVLSTEEEENTPESYKDQVRSFLRGEQPDEEVST